MSHQVFVRRVRTEYYMYIAKVTTYKRGRTRTVHWRGRNDHSRGRNVQVAKRAGGETSKGRNVHKPYGRTARNHRGSIEPWYSRWPSLRTSGQISCDSSCFQFVFSLFSSCGCGLLLYDLCFTYKLRVLAQRHVAGDTTHDAALLPRT